MRSGRSPLVAGTWRSDGAAPAGSRLPERRPPLLRLGCLATVRQQRVVRSCLVRTGPSPPPAGGLAAPPRPSVWLPGCDSGGGGGEGEASSVRDRNRRKRTARRGPSTKIRPNTKQRTLHHVTHEDKTANVWSTATSFYYYIIFVDDSFFAKYL